MKNLREQMKMDLELKCFSTRTQDAYIAHAKKFAEYFMKSPADLGEKEIKEYLHYLITERKLSSSYINTTYSALKFLYCQFLEKYL